MLRRCFFAAVLIFLFAVGVSAEEFEAPPVPRSVERIVPEEATSFAEGLWHVVRMCFTQFSPALTQASGICLKVLAVVMFCAMITGFSEKEGTFAVRLSGVAAVGSILLSASDAFLELGEQTIRSLSEYGKLLLPVMTGTLAAQGGGGTATALYGATMFFNTVLSSGVCSIMIPLLYLFLTLAIGFSATGEMVLGKFRDMVRWLIQWVLKMSLYLFTGFLTVTGVVSGSADAAALKAAKITISGVVPVVGGILADASEAVLVGAGVLRSSIGVYGLLTVGALFLSPFAKMGAQYLLVKLTAGICVSFAKTGAGGLVQDFSCAMGLMLAATATHTVLLMISTVCFMKGVG